MTMKTCNIPTCGARFQSSRSDARYCSPKCRAKASRLRAKGEEIPMRERTMPPDSTKLDSTTAKTSGNRTANTSESSTAKTTTTPLRSPVASPSKNQISPQRLQAQIHGLGNALKGFRRELNEIRAWCKGQPDPQDVNSEIEALRREMKSVDTEKASHGLRRRLAKLEDAAPSRAKLNGIEDDLARLGSKVSKLDREFSEQQAEIDEISQLKERMDDNEGHILALAKRDWVLFHGLEKAGVKVEFEKG